jgi:hypothetical protein
MSQPSVPPLTQPDSLSVPVGIAQPDGHPQSSEGNQRVKTALEHLQPDALAQNLDPQSPNQPATEDANTAPFAAYVDGTLPDTAKDEPSQSG